MSVKKAILVVSFGTSYLDALEKNINSIENRIQENYPDYKIYRAFTSKMIIKKLATVYEIQVDTVMEAINRMHQDGITDLLVQPTHIINGLENDIMTEEILQKKSLFQSIRFGEPLLSRTDDYLQVVSILAKHYIPDEKEALVLMGHGTSHYSNSAYPALDYTFKEQGYANVFVGTVEGYPEVEQLLTMVRKQHPTKVILLPLMLVAGDHAENDMASDEEDSWKSIFIKEGYEVNPIIKGLGELSEIQDLYLTHIEKALG